MNPPESPPDEPEYPESIERPTGQAQLHGYWTRRLIQLLEQRYRDQRVLVGGDLTVYLAHEVSDGFVVPDVCAVKDCDPLPLRQAFRPWVEDRVPSVAVDVRSKALLRDDEDFKRHLYADMGVPECFVYDPSRDTGPSLQGHRLQDGEYVPLEPDASGRLLSEQLDAYLRLTDDGSLQLSDRTSGERLLTEAETERLGREHAEAELARLRNLLRQQDVNDTE